MTHHHTRVSRRHTKIIATLGPASSTLETISQMIDAGVNVFRLNFSHGDHAFHQQLIQHIREASAKLETEVGILADLQGPKIRIGDIPGGEVMVKAHDILTITTNPNKKGDKVFFTPVSTFAKDVMPGEKVLIDDGLLELTALDKDDDESVRLEVIYGGMLKSRKGMNLPHTKLSIPSYTEKDLKDLTFIVTQDIDFVALSFVRTAKDIEEFNDAMLRLGRTIPIIAKIEKPEALKNVESIIDLCYGVMIARGDLGVEVPPEQVPYEQKRISRYCNQIGKPVIIATQILESMVTKAVPTRAEANDVANAVLDGGDALMLSAETAAGVDPVRCVATMARIMKTVEDQFINNNQFKRYLFKDYVANKMPDALCYSAVKLGIDLDAKLISCVTKTGTTALQFARHRVAVPLLAITDSQATIRKMALSWGIECSLVNRLYNAPECLDEIIQTAEEYGKLKTGDLIVVTLGLPDFTFDHTNTIKVHNVNRERKSSFI